MWIQALFNPRIWYFWEVLEENIFLLIVELFKDQRFFDVTFCEIHVISLWNLSLYWCFLPPCPLFGFKRHYLINNMVSVSSRNETLMSFKWLPLLDILTTSYTGISSAASGGGSCFRHETCSGMLLWVAAQGILRCDIFFLVSSKVAEIFDIFSLILWLEF
jgi:hypothetical protein